MKIFCIIILVILFEESCCKHPVLLVPGDGGSHLHVQYSKPPHVYCGRENKWMLLWFNAYYILFPFALDCFIKSATLEYDKSTQRTSSPNFCDIRVPGFGDLDSIDYISNVKISKTSYYYYLINDLVMNHGYDPHTDIRGAPYDFRKSPNEMQEFMRDMKNLIEEMYEVNRKSVVIVGHSLGTLYLTLLLHTMTQEWKNKYINTFISVSGPYGGAVDALQTVLSGRNEHIWTVNPAKVQPVQSSWPSTYFLMPSMDLWTTKTVVSIKKMTFNTSSILNLLKMSKIPNAVEHYKNNIQLQKNLTAPKTKVYCIYTDDLPTSEYLNYQQTNFPSDQPRVSVGRGDGTVNLASLRKCSNWKMFQDQPVITKVISKVSHLHILRDKRFLTFFSTVIRDINRIFENNDDLNSQKQ